MAQQKKYQQPNPEDNFGKVPPQDIEIENVIIGCVLLYPNDISRVQGLITHKSFYREANQIVFFTIENMYANGINIDILTVVANLKSIGKLEEVGGAFAVTKYTDRIVGNDNLEQWCEIIQDKYLKRENIRICLESINKSYDESTSYEDVFNDTQEKIIQTSKCLRSIGVEKNLIDATIDTKITVDKPPTILSIKDDGTIKRLFTLGNFSCITGKAKSRKTFFVSLVTSSMLSNMNTDKFIGSMVSGKDIIMYFDTEQGLYDCQNVVKRIENMAGYGKTNLKSFTLRSFTPNERCMIIEQAFKTYGEKSGLCVIDGVADLAFAINDEQEATRVTTMLLRLSKVYNCHIITVIHQNKNDNFATGHLGSSIMKKAEAIISVTKKGSFSEVSCEMIRGTADFNTFEMYINEDGIPETLQLPTSKPKEYRPSFDEQSNSHSYSDTPF